ncbi:cation:proton antiporter [Sphingomonas flavalba]|uniref:cation:proton antiporter n=1 Tax=Sphingomonas flavalba TaxID=2559804 RepID=UPI001EF1389A|nr:sodium:proton antiporter [Sphingomonas flavalba]
MLFESLIVKIALIGVLGIGAQWLAWRIGKPAIGLMLIAGFLAGPVSALVVPGGIINPNRDFGLLMGPIIKLAVAVILFEGGLSLNFRDLRLAGGPVLRLTILGVPIGWALGTAAAYYGAGLSLPVSALFGGIMVVTGPTVIGPLLRTLRVPARVRNTLKWEGIVNDPIGALLAVAIYAYVTYQGPDVGILPITADVAAASLVAGFTGAGLGFGLTWLFRHGLIPEYLKVPVVLVTVIAGFVAMDVMKHETGLITVTIMGVVIANQPLLSGHALRRFKEDLAVLLVSGVFILMPATLDWGVVSAFKARFLVFLILLLFVVRPLTVLISLLGSSMPWRERLFIAWIAPRGVVAVAITGLFAIRMTEFGVPDANALIPLSFGVVVATIIAHGFSAKWVAQRLGIWSSERDGVMIVGANDWTIELGATLQAAGIPVTIADPSKFALRAARKRDLAVYRGDILDEVTQDHLDLGQYQLLIAATDNDAYNALISADLGPELGPDKIVRVAPNPDAAIKGRGRALLESGAPIDELLNRQAAGWGFTRTKLTEKFGYAAYRKNLAGGGEPVLLLKDEQRLLPFASNTGVTAEAGDTVIAYLAPASAST